MTRGPNKRFQPDEALRCAMELFWAKGYAATGMADLLRAMGIARKSLYDTFGSKRELFLRALELYVDTELSRWIDLLDAQGSPIDNIRNALLAIQRVQGVPGSRGCMLGTNTAHFDSGDQEMVAILDAYHLSLERGFARALRKARDAGEISQQASPLDLARMLVATAQGVALLARSRSEPAFVRSVVRAAIRAVEAA